ncbi:Protein DETOXIFICATION 40 [Camellia lanceoleosa]|uniref:Protein DETOXIFICATION 40 n=1 Tax=Camellia lanceoleosa TaxID=1840588 RepID=A0ACC0H710_9ERIC|nr:Protein DETOXIFICATION 40 [Camellia lanceoleosa]
MTSDQHQYPISDHCMTSALRCHDQRSTTICDQISALGFGTAFHVLGFGFHNHWCIAPTTIVVLALRNGISYAFMDGEIVARAVSELCPLLAFSLILNGIQPLVWEYGQG